MFRQLAILCFVAGSTLIAPAEAQTVPLKERCAGVLTDVAPGSLAFEGLGHATHFGRYAIVGSNSFDDQGNVLDGEFTSTISDGSTISGVYEGTYTPLEDGRVRFEVHIVWLEGTRRLTGVTGEADVVAFLDGVAPGAAFSYEGLGTLTFP